ncbi:hypothetical protein B9Z55_016985 [Caenorhabditis nigoni]|uniref:Uncharacterized protein n=1 Tax=Caenorhabditis nigoni TaxID=1611254 RepID=A0A2G5T7P4_9PELO|nr:hypothetical protein B9Z55_016985 [Caenorhabditis nigoni]
MAAEDSGSPRSFLYLLLCVIIFLNPAPNSIFFPDLYITPFVYPRRQDYIIFLDIRAHVALFLHLHLSLENKLISYP